jgi:hypothetical protein
MQMPSSIEIILDRVKTILRELESQDVSAKLVFDDDAGIVKIYGEESDYVKRAHSGLSDIQELAYTTAEHHPYWAILYHASEISKTVLEKWESQLTHDQMSEMSWRCDEIKMAIDRMTRT